MLSRFADGTAQSWAQPWRAICAFVVTFLNPSFPLSEAKAKLKCSECGAKGEMLRIDVVGR
jgi:hypothetical protein